MRIIGVIIFALVIVGCSQQEGGYVFNDMKDLEDELIAWGCFNRELREELMALGIDKEGVEL